MKSAAAPLLDTPEIVSMSAPPTPDAVPNESSGLALVVERLALHPEVDVAKLEKIIELQERLLAHQARADFYAAFAAMQGDLPSITEKGEIAVDGVIRSRFARNEDIQEQIRPILQKHGFALSFRNEAHDGLMKVTAVLSHRSGHSEQDEFVSKPDDGGKMNSIQRIGSTRSYGQRYTTIALLNIVTKGEDDDGARAGRAPAPAAKEPAGYADWVLNIEAVADEGLGPLQVAFQQSKREYREYITRQEPARWQSLKAKAGKVAAS